jgi:hypothetical protein
MNEQTVIPVVANIFTPPATLGHTDTQNRVSVQPLVQKVGAGGFEPPTSRTRTVRSSRAEPRPEFFQPVFLQARVFGRRTYARLRLRHYNAAHYLWQGAHMIKYLRFQTQPAWLALR